VAGTRPYSEVAATNISNSSYQTFSQLPITASSRTFSSNIQKRPVDPKHTLVIEKIANAHQLKDSLSLQAKIRSCDETLIPLINNAKITINGNLLIEAKDETAFQNMSAKIPAILPQLGPESKSRSMQAPMTKSAIVYNVPTSYSKETLLQHSQIEFPSASEAIDLKKPNSTAPRRPIKITLTDTNEFQRLLGYGLKIGWELFNAEEWIPSPLQCYKCQRFGHNAKFCNSNQRCVNCGEEHPKEGRCQRPTKCSNCKGEHLASNKKCPARKEIMRRNASEKLITQHHG
jgi:hypothetical protein